MLTRAHIDEVVRAALDEDAPWGDLTSETLIPADATATAELRAREAGVFSGGDVFASAFRLTDPRLEVTLLRAEGEAFARGDVLALVSGPARGLLTAERVGLNFVQRMSGIATLTAAYVAAVAHTPARIVDTRKTTPGLRRIERHAVRSGGGRNHRFSLSDAVMAKDNHLAVLTARHGSVTAALQAARENLTLDDLRTGVERIGGRTIVEASGGVDLSTVAAIAETGVDVISVGALTHSARALDLGLDVRVEG